MQYQLSTQSRRPAIPGAHGTHTETTRYLCAAAHFDEKFRNYVLSHIVEEKHKAVGELYGMDIVTIVNWCLTARLRTRIRDCILLFLALSIGIHYFTNNIPSPVFFLYGSIHPFLLLVPLLPPGKAN
jgi:hypothetical protein